MPNFTTVVSGGKFDVDLVNDGWTALITNILPAVRKQPLGAAAAPSASNEALVQRANVQKMERVRARVDAVVQDRATAEALKPCTTRLASGPASTACT